MATEEILDEEDWVEIEKSLPPSQVLAEVSIRVTIATIGHGGKGTPKARATIAFRGKAALWVVANGPRFRIAIGGSMSNFLRIVPDVHRGKFEFSDTRGGTKRISLGVIAAWPREDRVPTACEWNIADGGIRLRLPADFAVPRVKGVPIPEIQRAAPLTRIGSSIPFPGDPAPARSALGRR